MPVINTKKEWKFIQEEVHLHSSEIKNGVKREALFYLQIELSKVDTDKKDPVIYLMLKDLYKKIHLNNKTHFQG